jgi:signal transduction histidine kinase
MTELLEDVLHFGRAESGRLPFSPDTLDAGSMVHKLVQEVQRGTGADHVFDVQGLDRIGLIDADEQLFRLILSNLLSNAVKYSDAGSTIRVEMERSDETLQMSVADEGIGIPEDQRDRLFDPFYRAENVGTIRGTGLGLAILNEAVALHGGTVAVESTCGVGTTFTVQLPLCQPEAEPPA